MAAGIATLRELQKPGTWETLERRAKQLEAGLCSAAKDAGVPLALQRVGTMSTPFFTAQPVRDWPSAKQSDTSRYATFFRAMLEEGVYLAPSQFEAGFLSTAHGDAEIEKTIQAARAAFQQIRG
jgi:glutamate-1-semialdehyde 2,1-aminomutase